MKLIWCRVQFILGQVILYPITVCLVVLICLQNKLWKIR